MITLDKMIEELQKIKAQHPSFGKLPIVYAHDDEGNAYQKVNNPPSPMIVENIDEYYLEPVIIEEGDTISEVDINCIIIN